MEEIVWGVMYAMGLLLAGTGFEVERMWISNLYLPAPYFGLTLSPVLEGITQ